MLKQLEEAPLAWKGLKKKMFQRREQLAPLQQAEAIEVRRRSDVFSEKVGNHSSICLLVFLLYPADCVLAKGIQGRHTMLQVSCLLWCARFTPSTWKIKQLSSYLLDISFIWSSGTAPRLSHKVADFPFDGMNLGMKSIPGRNWQPISLQRMEYCVRTIRAQYLCVSVILGGRLSKVLHEDSSLFCA